MRAGSSSRSSGRCGATTGEKTQNGSTPAVQGQTSSNGIVEAAAITCQSWRCATCRLQ